MRKHARIRLCEHQQTHQTRQREAVPEDVAKNVALVTVPSRRRARDDDALRVDHLAHDAAGAVGGGHEHGTQVELFGSDALQAAEQDVRGRVGSGERDAQPAKQRPEERIQHTGSRKRESERGVQS